MHLHGITGVGKSYYSEKISEELNVKKINTIRTRKIRKDEQNGRTGYFMTKEELNDLENQGEIAYRFEVFGGEYAYLTKEIYSDNDYVMEMHYTTIDDWKRIKPDIKTIYILPTDINVAIEKTKNRNLSKEKEVERIEEIKEQYTKFINDENLRKKFDFCIYNNYDEESKTKIIELVKNLKQGEYYANLLFTR